jgi:23S rRNA pseudouridine1911/1915/1917 synthase
MQKIIIKKNDVDIRLDKFLSREFFSPRKIALQSRGKRSRGEIIKNIKEGSILINEKKVKPSYSLKENDTIIINFKTVPSKLVPNKNIAFEIIYQDKNIVAINKPAGLKVHPSSIEEDNTLVNGLLSKFPEIENVNDGSCGSSLRPGIIHRLDQDTSGIMIVARNQKSFNKLKEIFQIRKIIKKYLALVLGKIKDKKGFIEKPIARSSSYKKQTIAGRKTKTIIRKAVTEYKVIQEFSDFSLVEVWPKTGRMHQIRIHFFSLGNPVAGDKKYKLKKLSKIILPKRQLLHAEKLDFELFDKKYSFSAELPQDFKDFLTKLQ